MAGDGNGRPTFEEKKEAIRVRARECQAVVTRGKEETMTDKGDKEGRERERE